MKNIQWITAISLLLAFGTGFAQAANNHNDFLGFARPATSQPNNQTDFNLNVSVAQSTVTPGQQEKITVTAQADVQGHNNRRSNDYHLVVTITLDGNVIEHYREQLNVGHDKTIQRVLGYRVPKNAPDGTYTVTATIRQDGDVLEQDSTTFTIGGTTTPTPVAGVCGSANGVSVSAAPANNLCTTGTASALSGTGPWNWTCAGHRWRLKCPMHGAKNNHNGNEWRMRYG